MLPLSDAVSLPDPVEVHTDLPPVIVEGRGGLLHGLVPVPHGDAEADAGPPHPGASVEE